MEAHALEVLLLHLQGLLLTQLVGYNLQLSEDWPMVGEVNLLDAAHRLQCHLVGVLFPKYPIAPGGHSIFLAGVVLLRFPVVLVSGGKVDLALGVVFIKLVLQLPGTL